MGNLNNLLIIIGGGGVVVFFVLAMIAARLYQRASKEISFVRTGFGGEKVIKDGGALVLPVLHEIIRVNMNTLRLEVERKNEQALITKDRMRVNVKAEFYVRVAAEKEAIATAARALGDRTMEPQRLKELVEGKFVDSLRAVAADMEMGDLHEQRGDFVQKVQNAVAGDLEKNGLELETVSLTALDQTAADFFNENNAFDAEGLRKLREITEMERKRRNDIERDREVEIETKNLEAEKQKQAIRRENEYVRLETDREVANRGEQEKALMAQERADREREAQEAEIAAKREVKLKDLAAQQEVEERRILKEQTVQERDITKARTVETAEIERQKAVELTEQDRAIAIAEKSKSQSEAEAEADAARAKAVQAEEQVVTVREVAKAERQKSIKLVAAREEAEQEAITVMVAAEADKKAAGDQAEAVRTLAQADADKIRIAAEGDAQAERVKAAAAEVRYTVDAEGTKALHEAENVLTNEIINLRIKLALIQQLPQIVAESVKPLEQIDDIKILDVAGLGAVGGGFGGGSGGGGNGGGGGGSMSDQLVNAALRYRGQAPLVDSLLKELGLSGGDITKMVPDLLGEAGDARAQLAAAEKQADGAGAAKAKKGAKAKPAATPAPSPEDLPTNPSLPEIEGPLDDVG